MGLAVFAVAWTLLILITRVMRLSQAINPAQGASLTGGSGLTRHPYDRRAFIRDINEHAPLEELIQKRRNG
jgi:hypothetical protein